MENCAKIAATYCGLWQERGPPAVAGISEGEFEINRALALCLNFLFQGNIVSNIPGIVIAAQEGLEAQQAKESKGGDKVNLPTNDITREHRIWGNWGKGPFVQ